MSPATTFTRRSVPSSSSAETVTRSRLRTVGRAPSRSSALTSQLPSRPNAPVTNTERPRNVGSFTRSPNPSARSAAARNRVTCSPPLLRAVARRNGVRMRRPYEGDIQPSSIRNSASTASTASATPESKLAAARSPSARAAHGASGNVHSRSCSASEVTISVITSARPSVSSSIRRECVAGWANACVAVMAADDRRPYRIGVPTDRARRDGGLPWRTAPSRRSGSARGHRSPACCETRCSETDPARADLRCTDSCRDR